MSFTQELGTNLPQLNIVNQHDNVLDMPQKINILDVIKEPLVQEPVIKDVQPVQPEKLPTHIPMDRATHVPVQLTAQTTQSIINPRKKVSFQPEVQVVEPDIQRVTHPIETDMQLSRTSQIVPRTTSGHVTSTVNNITGFKMSISTLYFIGLLILIGIVAYFQQKRI